MKNYLFVRIIKEISIVATDESSVSYALPVGIANDFIISLDTFLSSESQLDFSYERVLVKELDEMQDEQQKGSSKQKFILAAFRRLSDTLKQNRQEMTESAYNNFKRQLKRMFVNFIMLQHLKIEPSFDGPDQPVFIYFWLKV